MNEKKDSKKIVEVFGTAKEVAAYLKAEGFKVSLRSVYNHIQERKLPKDKEGKFQRKAVERYAARFLPRLDGKVSDQHVEGLQKQKLEAEVRRATEDARLKRLRADVLDGKLVPADLFERALAARAVLLKRGLTSLCHEMTEKIIETVNGDPNLAPHLLDLLLKEVRSHLNYYAQDQDFSVEQEALDSVLHAARAREVV